MKKMVKILGILGIILWVGFFIITLSTFLVYYVAEIKITQEVNFDELRENLDIEIQKQKQIQTTQQQVTINNKNNDPYVMFNGRKGNIIPMNNIEFYKNDQGMNIIHEGCLFVIRIDPTTNSMEPALKHDRNTIIADFCYDMTKLKVGDIISYRCNLENGCVQHYKNQYVGETSFPILHRIMNIMEDEKGIYFKTKGDNVPRMDPYRPRIEDVEDVVVAIIS